VSVTSTQHILNYRIVSILYVVR